MRWAYVCLVLYNGFFLAERLSPPVLDWSLSVPQNKEGRRRSDPARSLCRGV